MPTASFIDNKLVSRSMVIEIGGIFSSNYSEVAHLVLYLPEIRPYLLSRFNISFGPSSVLPVRRNAGCSALWRLWPRGQSTVQPAPRSGSDRMLLAGLPCFGFSKAALNIVWFGIFCFDHGPCSRSRQASLLIEFSRKHFR